MPGRLMPPDQKLPVFCMLTPKEWLAPSIRIPYAPTSWRWSLQGLIDIVKFIIEQPSTVQQRDRQRKTPLQIARQNKQAEVEDVLRAAAATDSGFLNW